MSDLLTPSESQVLQTFFSSMDYNDSNDVQNPSNPDWAAYNNGAGQGHHIPDVPHIQGREALAKATKDLMSLDADSWNSAAVMHQYQQQQQQHTYNFMNREHQSSQYNSYELQNHGQTGLYQQQQPRNEEYYLPKQGSQSPQPPLHHPVHSHPPQPLSISSHPAGSNMRSTYSSSMGSPPTPASSSFSFGSSSTSNSTVPSPPPSADRRPASNSSNKRSAEAMPYVPSNKRSRPSPPANPSSLPTKATLLSPSQKKANHIQSEQKRRANIRRGYEALCETVPALREAIRLEEEAQVVEGFTTNGKKPKRGRRIKVDDGTGEKIDGRAGPRSENIVLGKTIEYIKELLDDRQDLLSRLERARSSLAPGHPSSDPSDPQPLWEREWKGGSGKEVDADEEEDEEDDE